MKKMQLTILIVMAGLFFLTFNSEAQSLPFLTNGLVAFYPFDGTANDVWGTNDGIIQGEEIWTNGIFGGSTNSAFYFDGQTRVVIQDSPSLDLTNAITISAWFNANDWNGNNRIVNKGDLQYQLTGQYGNFNFELNNASGSDLSLYAAYPTVGVWHHSVATYDGCTMAIYIDGKMVASQPASGAIITFNSSGNPNLNMNIGAKSDSSNPVDFFNGSITDVAIYNRSLSPLEVAELYQSSLLAGITVVPGILVAGNTNQTYSIQYITNLSSANWTTLISNIVLQGNSYLYCDTNAVGKPSRFYRVVAQ